MRFPGPVRSGAAAAEITVVLAHQPLRCDCSASPGPAGRCSRPLLPGRPAPLRSPWRCSRISPSDNREAQLRGQGGIGEQRGGLLAASRQFCAPACSASSWRKTSSRPRSAAASCAHAASGSTCCAPEGNAASAGPPPGSGRPGLHLAPVAAHQRGQHHPAGQQRQHRQGENHPAEITGAARAPSGARPACTTVPPPGTRPRSGCIKPVPAASPVTVPPAAQAARNQHPSPSTAREQSKSSGPSRRAHLAPAASALTRYSTPVTKARANAASPIMVS